MAVPNNPAGRLHVFLASVLKIGRGKPTSALEGPVRQALGMEKSSYADLFSAFADIHRLPDQIEALVEQLPFTGTSFVQRMPEIRGALGLFHPSTQSQHFAARISDTAMDNLRVCDEVLSQHFPETVLSKEERIDLLARVEELLNELDSIVGPLPDDIRTTLRNRLSEMRDALCRYRVGGIEVVRAAFERAVGTFAASPDLYDRAKKTSPWVKFASIMAAFGAILTAGNQGTELVQTWFPDALPSADPTSEPGGSDDDVIDAVIVGDGNSITVEAPGTDAEPGTDPGQPAPATP